MSQALYTSMSGIAAATTDLEVISNNIANVNTTGFKSSAVHFSDVYYITLSAGSVASGNAGGTNPIQVGVGTQVSSISRNFSSGSATATGVGTDLMIEGDDGFFTVQATDGTVYYTRAGDFSWDDQGNLVTSSGYKALGAGSILSSTSSTGTVYVPTSLISVVNGNPDLANVNVSDINGVSGNITSGYFIVSDGATAYNVPLSIANLSGTMQDMVDAINTSLTGQGCTSLTASIGTAGKIIFTYTGSNTLTFSTSTNPYTDGSGNTWNATNLLTEIELDSDSIIGTGSAVTDSSKVLDYSANITDVTSAAEATNVSNITINNDGTIEATYANGDTLSVQLSSDNTTYQFVYTTTDASSNAITIAGTSLSVSSTVAIPANFVIQLATVTNTDGLLSSGSNLYKAGANCGAIVYTVAAELDGGIKSGYLEASNVDLSKQLSEMILAQRAIEANSRVFTTTSDVMNTIVQMGR